MTRKILNASNPGDTNHWGTDDSDKINAYLTGADQTSTDPVVINTRTTLNNSIIPYDGVLASYTIYIDTSDNNRVKARNNSTGVIDYTTTAGQSPTSADTTTLLNNVFIAIQATGGTVYLRKGTYVINNTIDIGKPDETVTTVSVILVGEGMTSSTIQFDSSAAAPANSMLVSHCNATFEKLTVDGNGKSNGLMGGSASGINMIVKEVHFLNNATNLNLWAYSTHATPSVGAKSLTVERCWFDKTNNFDQCAIGVTNYAIVTDCFFDKTTAGINGSSTGASLTSGGAQTLIISNNVFNAVAGEADPIVSIEPWSTNYNYVLIDSNILDNARLALGGTGDWTQNTGGLNTLYKKVIITNNIIQGESLWVNGPSTTPTTTSGNITYLLIANNTVSESIWAGIWVANVTGPTIVKNNIIKDSNFSHTAGYVYALIYTQEDDQIDVAGNLLHMTGSTNSQSPYGILYNSCTNERIYDNKIVNVTANPSIQAFALNGANVNINQWGNQGLVTDDLTATLSNKTLTSPTIASILNTGTLTLPTSTDTLVGRATTDTLTNKTLDAGSNTLIQYVQSPLVKRTGYCEPKANTLFLQGALADHTFGTTGTIANSFDTTEGVVTAFPTTAVSGVVVGLVSPTTGVGIGRRLFAAKVKTRCKIDATTSSRFYFGFTSATALPISDTPLATTDSGVLIGWRSTDTNFQIFNNDGSAAAVVTQVAGPIAKDALYHTFEINWTASGNINVIIDNTTTTISTRMPATTTNLFFNQQIQTTSTTARTHTTHGTWFEADK